MHRIHCMRSNDGGGRLLEVVSASSKMVIGQWSGKMARARAARPKKQRMQLHQDQKQNIVELQSKELLAATS